MQAEGIFFLLSLLFSGVFSASQIPQPSNQALGNGYFSDIQLTGRAGGGQCATCTIALQIIENLALVQNKKIDKLLDEICGYFPAPINGICIMLVDSYGEEIIELVQQDLTPDEVCHAMKICTDPTCVVKPSASTFQKPFHLKQRQAPKENPWDYIWDILQRVAQHKPDLDIDDDLFSPEPLLRGSNWRGRDCSDLFPAIYPGRHQNSFTPDVDHNCNGIYGVDPSTGRTYEDLLCSGVPHIGVAIVGDSAGAHFSIPPSYMNASEINENTYDDLLEILMDEFDWPHRSGYTGYVDSTPGVPVSSVYKKMFERNRCNHRDYQNMGVNGARSGAVADNIVKTIARNQTNDDPVLLFLELIGNDVCSPSHDLNHMTTVPEFKANILKTLTYLDQTLPKGSHVISIGLAQGIILYETLHNRTHPIGVTYKEVYDFLNCLGINPCFVWMNSNATIRELGQKRADELSAVYPEIIANYKWKNFDMTYYPFPLEQIIDIWKKQGGQVWQLIEPIDGFHPNQISHYLTANYFWGRFVSDHPEFVGPVNPNNARIQQLFGNQGGY